MFTKTTTIVLTLALTQLCFAPPVTQNKETEKVNETSDGLEQYMEYHRYLREVVNALESDPDFRRKLEKASEDDIRSGKIAEELEFVSHHVRTRLDELKRVELERLKELTQKKKELLENNKIDDPSHHHLDRNNPHTFEIADLQKLIKKTTEDLAEADRKRREEFKQYEMQKEYEKQVKLNQTQGEERVKLEKELKEMEEKHKKHEKLHEPGHKPQLEEVWEEQDHMQQEFNPKTFFMMHDLDSNGLWDETEVKALFVKELDKMYSQGAPEDDMRERIEEMERMRESVFKEIDTNRDGFIDFEEFLAQTKRNEFQQDHGWQGLDEQKIYTDEELEQYIQMHQRLPDGYYPNQQPPPGYHPNQQPPPGYHPDQQPPQGFHPNQQPPPGYHPNQQPPPGYHPNQQPPPGYHSQGVPSQGAHAQGGVPQQGQFHPGDLPQAQVKQK